MDIQVFNDDLFQALHEQAKANERKRQNFDLRNSPEDGSQRMLNALEPGAKVPIHRHTCTSETVVCLEGCLEWIIYDELPTNADGGPIHDGNTALVESEFAEVGRYRLCPREGKYGIQVPPMTWHSIVVHEPSTIFEGKDGPYMK